MHNRAVIPRGRLRDGRALWAASVLAMAVLAFGAACGGGGGAAVCTASPVPAGAPCIDQDHLKFSPAALTVSAAEPVYFRNSESALHTVTINGMNASGDMKKGALFTWMPSAPGTYRITCDYHPQMRATLTVQ